MRSIMFAALAAVGLTLTTVSIAPAQYIQYTSPYTYAPNTYYFNPNVGSYYVNPVTTSYSGYYAGPTVYGPGYTASYPYMYNQYNYGYYQPYYYPSRTYYRTYRGW